MLKSVEHSPVPKLGTRRHPLLGIGPRRRPRSPVRSLEAVAVELPGRDGGSAEELGRDGKVWGAARGDIRSVGDRPVERGARPRRHAVRVGAVAEEVEDRHDPAELAVEVGALSGPPVAVRETRRRRGWRCGLNQGGMPRNGARLPNASGTPVVPSRYRCS